MNRRTKSALLDIAAELIVSPIALYAKTTQLKAKFDDSDAGKKTNAAVKKAGNGLKQAGADISTAAKSFAESETGQFVKNTAIKTGDAISETARKVAESETVQKVKDAATDTFQKVSESETVQKVVAGAKETVQKVAESETVQKVRDAATDTFQKVSENETVQKVKEGAANAVAGAKETFGEIKDFLAKDTGDDGAVKEIIDDVDFSQIVSKEEAEEDVPEAELPPIDEEESAKEFEPLAEELGQEIADTVGNENN